MKNYNNVQILINAAFKAGFEIYGSFNEGEQHEILTCTKGKYSGEVIDIYYNWLSGQVSKVEYSTQFKGQEPTFKFN
jgi:hypothetical protein